MEEAGGESSSPLYREGGSYLKGMAVNSTVIADLLLPFCEAASINIKEISRTVRKRIVVSLLFADNQAVHQKLFREQHMDWSGVQVWESPWSARCCAERRVAGLSAGNHVHAARLDAHHEALGLCAGMDGPARGATRALTGGQWGQELQPSAETAELIHTAYAGLRLSSLQTKSLSALESLRVCFARVKVMPSWDLLCKTFVLCNLTDTDSLAVLSLLFAEGDPPMSVDTAKDLVRHMASFKHTRSEYSDLFGILLGDSHCQVRSHVVQQSLKQREALKETRRQHAVRSGAAFKKPSLTRMLEAKLLAEGSNHPQDSFASFCRASKFASNVNLRIRQVAYFLHCLPEHADKTAQLTRTLGGDLLILGCIQGLPTLMCPDVQARAPLLPVHLFVFLDKMCVCVGGRSCGASSQIRITWWRRARRCGASRRGAYQAVSSRQGSGA